jgi:CRP/FNR family transcriptional regulator
VLNRDITKQIKIPKELTEAESLERIRGNMTWRQAREKSDLTMYSHHLKKMIEIKKQIEDKIGYEKHPHDALWDTFEEELIQEIFHTGTLKFAKEGEIIMDIGDYVKAMPLLMEGAIKILREDDEGNELLLYFLERGDTCALTLSCCLGQTRSEIRAVAERDTTFIMVPIGKIEDWTAKYSTWRNFVFESYQSRLTEMLQTIDTLAFMNMDQRLLRYLQDKAKINQSQELQVTHQQIAYDLNTSRVVISRLLKKLEIDNKILLQRNHIVVLDL